MGLNNAEVVLQSKRWSERPLAKDHKIKVSLEKYNLAVFEWEGTTLLFDLDDLADLVRILQIADGRVQEVTEVTNYNVWTQ